MKALTTEQVLKQHIQAVKGRDLNRIAFDYADDAFFITDTGTTKGKEAIRDIFKTVFTDILPEGSTMTFIKEIVEGEVAYIIWSAKSRLFDIPSATDTFIIRNGKILVQTAFTILNPIG